MKKPEKPVYQQLIQNVKAGFSALDSSIQNEIVDFIRSQQSKNGGFIDRAGNPDPYYSLFGHWLCLATNMKKQNELLEQYLNKYKETRPQNLINNLAVFLISQDVVKGKNKLSVFTILKKHYRNRQTINLAYQFFLLILAIYASNKHKRLYFIFAKIVLLFYRPGNNNPCSLTAALLYAKNKLRLKYKKTQSKISRYINEHGGFKAFTSAKNSDMLSTGVSLFVLEKTGYDLRIIKPGCLNFVEQNYNSGAFLSGDGDKTKDLEYTFYGLLALGSLVKYEK